MDKAPGTHHGAQTRVSPELEYKVQVEKVKTLQVLSCDLAPKSNYPGNIEQATFSKTASP